MGAWGVGTFEDDTAMDLIDEWMESVDPISLIETSLREALSADGLDYDAGQVVAVASAVLDYSLGGQAPAEAQLDGFEQWLSGLDRSRLEALCPVLTQGLDRLLDTDSELCELWAENEELFPSWRQGLMERRERLMAV